MISGNQWNWTWAFLAIIIGFQSSTFILYGNLPHGEPDLGVLSFFIWSAMLGYGIPLATALLFCFAKRFSVIIGYGNAFLLSFIGVPVDVILVIMLKRFIYANGRPSSLVIVLGTLAIPLFLLCVAMRDLRKNELKRTNACGD
jgi:hypothetical protein